MGHQGRFGTLVEFDDSGKICWTWRSSDYLLHSDYVFYMPKDSELKFDPHDNAFFFDEKNKVIYFGFRNLSRIIKIEYPSGKVLNYYGVTFSREHPISYNGTYCNQHSIYRNRDGGLYIFNNNTCHDTDALPTAIEVKEPDTGHILQKVWEYVCPIEIRMPKGGFHYGGIAKELPDKSVFICMGSDYPKLMIVNQDKQTLWSGIPEIYDPTEHVWKAAQKVYRGDIIDGKDFKQLIWSAVRSKGN